MASDVPVMNGKICLVTGATDGIGKVTARVLAERGATVILVGRSADKLRRVADEIKTQTGSASVDSLRADLSSLQQVRDLAAQFKTKYSRLDVLVNNAGAMFMKRLTTVDGLEMTFALNHLNYFLLTHLLLDTLKTSAPARIVSVSSDAHFRQALDFDDLQYQRQKYSGFNAYGRSKLMNIYFTYELARRLEGSGVTANTLHPGFVATRFASNNWGLFGKIVVRQAIHLMAINVEKGALTSIYLASSPEVEGVSGQFFDKCKAIKSSEVSYDVEAQRRLWQISAEITGVGGR